MNTTVRIVKEARLLLWPWCAVMALISAQVILGTQIDTPSVLGLMIGVPLLATLSIGSELQNGTLSLLLSQPVDRTRLWLEKEAVLVVATLPIVGLSFFLLPEIYLPHFFLGALFIAVCSAMFWTLIMRSTIGGLTMNIAQTVAIITAGGLGPLKFHFINGDFSVFAVVYGLLMLGAGRWALLRFQAAGGVASSDLSNWFSHGGRSVTGSWLRSKPSSPLLNLVRRELRLLFPAWLLVGLAVATLIVMTLTGGLTGDILDTRLSQLTNVFHLVLLILAALVAVLSGCLSLGEERAQGTEVWNFTTPVKTSTQWWIKLAVAFTPDIVLAGVVGAAAITDQLVLANSLFAPFGLDGRVFAPFLVMLLAFSPLITFVAFWCASGLDNTAAAALAVVPAILIMSVFDVTGRLTPMTHSTWIDRILTSFHPYPFSSFTVTIVQNYLLRPVVPIEIVLVLILAATQSYRMFRSGKNVKSLLKNGAIACLVLFVVGTAFQTVGAMTMGAPWILSVVMRQTTVAVAGLNLDLTKIDSSHPLELTAAELSKGGPLNPTTLRWLEHATVHVGLATVPCYVFRNGALRNSPGVNVDPAQGDFKNGQVTTEKYPYYIEMDYPNGFKFAWVDNGRIYRAATHPGFGGC